MRKRLIVLLAVATAISIVGAATLQNVAGTVTDSNADPLPGIHVSFLDAVNAELLGSAMTDSNGHYDSGSIPAGNYRVRFSDPFTNQGEFYGDGGIDQFCDATVVPVPASMTTLLDAQMSRWEPKLLATLEGPIGGTVVDAATGMPLEGIQVSLLRTWSAETILTTMTDADGAYAFGSKEIEVVKIRFSDPTGAFFSEFYGAGSDVFCSAPIVRDGSATLDGSLDRVPPEHLTQRLADTVQSYDLPASVATMLGTPLTQVRALLGDDNTGNDAAACGQLSSFVSRVGVQERRGELSTDEANELRSLAANLRTVLGCQ